MNNVKWFNKGNPWDRRYIKMAVYKLFILNIIILTSALAQREGVGEPVIGDIQLVPSSIQGYYQPLVYFTNGIEPHEWGSICYDSIVTADARVVCNQVGFELDDNFPFMGADFRDNQYPIWLDDLECDENQERAHILSCTYRVAFGTERYRMPCSTNEYLIIKCDMTKPLNSGKYDGQLLLCPPDDYEETSSLFSISFGLIVMYSSKYEIWRGFNQPNNSAVLRGNEADAVCRQLGYTQAIPGSALTQRAMLPNYTFNHCYDDQPPFRVQSQAWLSTDHIHCDNFQKCFGCCFDYPSRDNCGECEKLNDIVIQCIFIPSQANFSSNTGGSCEYDNLMCDTKCESEIKKITNLTIAISVLCALFLLLTCTLSISIIIISCSIFKKRHANRNLQPERDGNGINDGDHHDHEAPAGEPRQNENDPLVAQGDN